MSKLHISNEISLPADAATQTLVVYGGKGMGKTNFAAVFAEELARTHQRFALLDPVGVSWGLQHGAGGKSPGLDILILGGAHGHLPIEPTAGAVVADFVVDETVNVVVDISRRSSGQMWGSGEKIRFVTEYTTRLYERQGERRRPLMQLIDEAGRFVPQNPPKGAVDIAKCVGAIEQLVELGRNVGVGVCLITQRSARMNKSVSELAECMIAFRTVGPRSVDAILDWLGEHIERERWRDLVGKLRTLPRGHALVVSPGWLGYEGIVPIRARTTYDSSATPTGRGSTPVQARWPDLEKYRDRMAETIEKALADDPRELKRRVRELEKQLAERVQVPAPPSVDVPGIQREARQALRAELGPLAGELVMRLSTLTTSLDQVVEQIGDTAGFAQTALEKASALRARVDKNEAPRATAPAPVPRPAAPAKAPVPPPRSPAPDTAPSRSLGKCERMILLVLSQYPEGCTSAKLALLAGYRWCGSFRNALASLRTAGLITGENTATMQITSAGMDQAAGFAEPLPTGRAFIDYWLNHREFGKCERAILQVLLETPEGLANMALAHLSGYEWCGSFRNSLSKLRTAGVIVGKNTDIMRLSDELLAARGT